MTTVRIPHSRPDLGIAERRAVERVLAGGRVGTGPEVDGLEAGICRLVGAHDTVAVHSGSAALHLALLGLGIGRRHRVGLPSYTCAAVLNAVHYVGARPVLLDVDPHTGNLEPGRSRRVDALIVPHMFGGAAPVDELASRGVPIVEDCAMALGGPRIGSLGRVGVTSFYATKLLAAGHGGAVWTRDRRIAARIRDLVGYDERENYKVRYNYRMSGLAAALAGAQLARLREFLRRRREIADIYYEALVGLPVRLPSRGGHTYYRFVLGVPKGADGLMRHLAERGIEAKRPVYRPLHRYFADTGRAFPGADKAHRTFVSIPIYPALPNGQARAVARAVRSFFEP